MIRKGESEMRRFDIINFKANFAVAQHSGERDTDSWKEAEIGHDGTEYAEI